VNNIMLSTTGVFTALIASLLLFILGYLLVNGARNLNLAFFTELPKPVGEAGGGMANAIIGSAKILGIATVIGVPVGFLGGVYLAEYGNRGFAFVVRYVTDLLNGVPSIVIGIFGYTLIVLRFKHFSTLAGGMALGLMMIPIAVRSTEEFLRAVPNARGRPRTRHAQMAGAGHRRDSRGPRRDHHGHHAEPGARGGRNGATPLHQLQQPLLESGNQPRDGVTARHDLQLRSRSERRLAQAGVGGRVRAPDAHPDDQCLSATHSGALAIRRRPLNYDDAHGSA
jgi:hypothetical protein